MLVANRIDVSSIHFNLIGTVISVGLITACVCYFAFVSTLRGMTPSDKVIAVVCVSIVWFMYTVINIRVYASRIGMRSM